MLDEQPFRASRIPWRVDVDPERAGDAGDQTFGNPHFRPLRDGPRLRMRVDCNRERVGTLEHQLDRPRLDDVVAHQHEEPLPGCETADESRGSASVTET